MIQDTIGAIIVVALIWFVFKLAFGGSGASDGANAGRVGAKTGAGPTKETAAAKAWRDARAERERELRRRKQDLLEAARRKYVEKDNSTIFTAGPSMSARADEPGTSRQTSVSS